MANKEKAINIGLNNLDRCFGSKKDYGVTCALEMAQWKDEQFKEQLSNIKDEIQSNLCASSGFNDEYSYGYQDCGMKVMEMIDKILTNKS